MKRELKWGIMGCAKIAKEQFLPALADAKSNVLHAISSRNYEQAKMWADKWGAKVSYGSYDEMLADSQVEAIYIPLPNSLHCEWTIKALEAKKHVLCEKPMAINSEQALAILKTAKREKKFYMEAFMYRFHPQIEQVLTWVREGEIGEVRLVEGSFSFLLKERENIRLQEEQGGGSLWDVGCYPIHFMNILFGGPPRKVIAQSHFETVDLSTGAILRYGAKQQGVFHCSFNMVARSGLEIVGTEGRIIVPNPWRPDTQKVSITLVQGHKHQKLVFPIRNPYQLEIEHFQACAKGEERSQLPGYLGLDVISTIEACYQSAKEGKEIEVYRHDLK